MMFDIPEPRVTVAMSDAQCYQLLNVWRSMVVTEGRRRLELARWDPEPLERSMDYLDELLLVRIEEAVEDKNRTALQRTFELALSV